MGPSETPLGRTRGGDGERSAAQVRGRNGGCPGPAPWGVGVISCGSSSCDVLDTGSEPAPGSSWTAGRCERQGEGVVSSLMWLFLLSSPALIAGAGVGAARWERRRRVPGAVLGRAGHLAPALPALAEVSWGWSGPGVCGEQREGCRPSACGLAPAEVSRCGGGSGQRHWRLCLGTPLS